MPRQNPPPASAQDRHARPRERTSPAQAEQPVPRLPHEHDQSADSQAGGEASGSALGRQAHADLQQGRVDTDRGATTDKLYNQHYRTDKKAPPRK
jgi:hypothetical protein